jgi:hypothetical protein
MLEVFIAHKIVSRAGRLDKNAGLKRNATSKLEEFWDRPKVRAHGKRENDFPLIRNAENWNFGRSRRINFFETDLSFTLFAQDDRSSLAHRSGAGVYLF